MSQMKQEFIKIIQELPTQQRHDAKTASLNMYNKTIKELDSNQLCTILCKLSAYNEVKGR